MGKGASRQRFRIGCAGWSVLSRHAQWFAGEGSHLARYATRFDAVEINSSFYRPHAAGTYARCNALYDDPSFEAFGADAVARLFTDQQIADMLAFADSLTA